MSDLFDAFWRAAAYCLHPRVILWSLLPLVVGGGAVAVLGWTYWESTVSGVRGALEEWELVAAMLQWLESIGANQLRTLMAPMIVVALSVPVVVVATLLLVALLVTPAVVRMVATRRFPTLERRHGAAWWQGVLWALACTAAAMAALVLSIPLWFVPPLVLLLPPLIWGWLTCRVFAFDALAAHATAPERRFVLRNRRWSLLTMGVVCGYLGALPSLLWAASAAALIFAPLLVVLSVWLYTLVFAFAACWFAHFTLAELQRLRDAQTPVLSVLPSSFATDPSP
jgi:Etoposide-induced protein 2.4 (EI24)